MREYRVEYQWSTGWGRVDPTVYDSYDGAEAHMDRLAGYEYHPHYRIVWREMPDWKPMGES